MSVKVNAEVAKTFFTHKGNNIHVCVCGKERKQLPRKGYTNLISHITVDHPEWQQELSQKGCLYYCNHCHSKNSYCSLPKSNPLFTVFFLKIQLY